ERGLERAARKRIERWRRIAREASEQSRRAILPEIAEPVAFGGVLQNPAMYRYALDEEPGAETLAHALPGSRDPSATVALLIGPEGGWTGEERAAFRKAGWSPVSLGGLILRAETAAIAALAVIRAAW
ncbi:MAG TPA: RsmE family RNA methyltransferase, partial [Bryobacteraceae bacterium]|nr:RsmE family RNA methyltransferase [Bryobacteraceae bacterium]